MRSLRVFFAISAAALTFGSGIALAAAAKGGDGASGATQAAIDAALKSHGRPQLDVYRDKDLKPAEVMQFAGIRPGMAVAEILPEYGYWTRIISGVVGPRGNTYMFILQARDAKPEKDASQNEPYTRVVNANAVRQQPEFSNILVLWDSLGSFPKSFNLPRQLDAVVMSGGYPVIKAENPKWDMVEGNKAIFRALKNGGTYLVMGAAANKGSAFSQASLRRADPDAIKTEILAAGFQLDGESNLLARTGDAHTAAADDKSDMYVLRFKKPMNTPNTDMRTKDLKTAMAGYYGSTRRTNPGLIRKGGKGSRERRVMFNPDMTYQEWGQKGTGNNPWQSGIYFFSADNAGCMIHMFPTDQQGFVNCDQALAPAGKKPGDMWFDGGTIREFVGPGYYQYPDRNATQGGTLGNTPQEIASKFGQLYAFAEKEGAEKDYLTEYLTAYRDFRAESGLPPAQLDAEFQKSYGKAVPALPSGQD